MIGKTVRVFMSAKNDGGRTGVVVRKLQPEWDSDDWDMWEIQFPTGKHEYGPLGKISWVRGKDLEVLE